MDRLDRCNAILYQQMVIMDRADVTPQNIHVLTIRTTIDLNNGKDLASHYHHAYTLCLYALLNEVDIL